ncbi:MAG: hypothetical protein WC087_00880 [Candidatus Paceibacterota bacterium]
MKNQSTLPEKQESLTPAKRTNPAEELFLLDKTSPWDERILSDTNIQKSASIRQQLVTALERIYSQVPLLMNIDQAIKNGFVSTSDAENLYRLLSLFLQEEHCSERFILYFPMELIPLNLFSEFREIYKQKWYQLLSHEDYRANFVDGDISEEEIQSGKIPEVIKATHLIPILIQKEIISLAEVLEIRGGSVGLLRDNIDEVLRAINGKELSKQRKISSQQISTARKSWEKKRDTQERLLKSANKVAELLIAKRITIEEVVKKKNYHLAITSVSIAIQRLAQNTRSKACAQRLYSVINPIMTTTWSSEDDFTKEIIESAWSHMLHVGIGDQKAIQSIGALTDRHEIKTFEVIVETIRFDEELKDWLMPIVISYGSRGKDFGTISSDFDFGIFVKPNVPMMLRSQIQKRLKKLLEPLGVKGNALEFWLEENDDGLLIQDFTNADKKLGTSNFVSTLFNGVWIGEFETIQLIYSQVLQKYLKLSEDSVQQFVELERSVLQYRLMHKNYHYFYPKRETEDLPRNTIDKKGAFWDPGYRRMASVLFLRKVFLPEIGEK